MAGDRRTRGRVSEQIQLWLNVVRELIPYELGQMDIPLPA